MKAFTVHGHFYQPPRENPWLYEVERQDSAAPYHDWNERIARECYEKNLPNYPLISFNFGPTLLRWMEEKAPKVYRGILEGDRISCRVRGHGNALAQCHNHVIMPLASRRDKEIQVAWGVRDFQLRFGRSPEGMWLPEMAVDLKTLEVLAEYGIKFTILAPHQIRMWRPSRKAPWEPFSEVFYPFPLRQILPNGRHLYIFVYHREMGEAVSFGRALEDPQALLELIEKRFSPMKDGLLHFATDGETFGHHRKKGAEILKETLEKLINRGVKLTNFASFMEEVSWVPPAQIRENTSWSCAHGVERWRADCGCFAGGKPGWNQKWRAPFREAMNWLKERLDRIFQEEGASLFKDPWAALLDYVEVMVRGPESLLPFLDRHSTRNLSTGERVKAAKLLEMARMGQYIFTSCGWFFADISGLEAVQNMTFAARAIELARDISGIYLEDGYLERLYKAKSNVPAERNGLEIYKRRVLPRRFTTKDITAHYLITSTLSGRFRETRLFRHRFRPVKVDRLEKGATCFCCGMVEVTNLAFQEKGSYLFSVLQYCPGDIHCTLSSRGKERWEETLEALKSAYHLGITHLVRELDRFFGPQFYGSESTIDVV